MEMKDKNSLLTIAIPTYKRPKYLRQAIDSAVNQVASGIDYNIIVVNNDPETDMTEVQKAYEGAPVNIRFYTNEKNLGMLGNVNRCVELADGKWIAFLHDDDLLLPSYLYQIKKYLNEESTACLIPRRYLLFEGKDGRFLEKKRKVKHAMLSLFPGRHMKKADVYPIYVEDNVYAWQNCYGAPSCGTAYNIEKIKTCGLFSPDGTYSWDYLSHLKLNQQYDVKILNQVLSVYRMSVGASNRPEVQLDFFKVFEALKGEFAQTSAGCEAFIKKYDSEMAYIDANIMSTEAKTLAKRAGLSVLEKRPSFIKYVVFMYKRIRYFANHHLDVEVPLDPAGRRILLQLNCFE